MWLKQSKERYTHIFGESKVHIFGDTRWMVDLMKKHKLIIMLVCYLDHFSVIMDTQKKESGSTMTPCKWMNYNG